MDRKEVAVKYYQHDIALWMDGTEGLSDQAYRAYHVICQLIYTHDGPISYHERGLAGRCNQSTRLFRKAFEELIIAGKLSLEMGKVHNQKCDEIISKVSRKKPLDVANPHEPPTKSRETSAKPRETSAKVVELSRKLLKNNDVGEPGAIYETRLEEKREKEKEEKEKSYHLIDEEFTHEFWKMYPHKVEAASTRLAYRKARLKHDKQTILEGARRYVLGKPEHYPWLNPTNFLERERFLDAPQYSLAAQFSQKVSPVAQAVKSLREKLE